jgi:chromosome segregation ATPase
MEDSQLNDPNQIALPNEIPPPPDLASLPATVLHSGTVETLLAMNDDLMARLKINIRRASILEQQIMEQERMTSELMRDNGGLTAELDVMREAQKEARIRLIEAEGMRIELGRLRSYRRRIHAWVSPLVKKLRSSQKQVARLEEALSHRETQLNDVRNRMGETIAHVQNRERTFKQDQSTLVAQYEERIGALEEQLEKLLPKAERFETATARAAETSNKLIFLERRNSELEARFQEDLAQIQAQTTAFRTEAKGLAVEMHELQKQIAEKTEANARLSNEHDLLKDQFESLQAVWADAQKRLEASKLQQEALNRLNQELSRQLKEVRRSHESEGANSNASPANVAVKNGQMDTNQNRMGKIDALLAEIESGFTARFSENSHTDFTTLDREP